jgi:hypothetical protein
MAHEIERDHLHDLHPARFTIDMYRRVPFGPVRVTTQVIRDGRRLRVVDADEAPVTPDGRPLNHPARRRA